MARMSSSALALALARTSLVAIKEPVKRQFFAKSLCVFRRPRLATTCQLLPAWLAAVNSVFIFRNSSSILLHGIALTLSSVTKGSNHLFNVSAPMLCECTNPFIGAVKMLFKTPPTRAFEKSMCIFIDVI